MRVNITYSIEIDKILEKVSDFLLETTLKASDVVNDLNELAANMGEDFSIEKSLEQIDKVRRELANIDHTMLDCTDILHGYQKALVQLREPQLPIGEQYDNETRDEETEEG